MPYFVKWYIAGQDDAYEQPIEYVDLADAMDFACSVLARDPTDVWIEDEKGKMVALDVRIRLHCQGKELPDIE
jgi:hypothetical protein